MNKFKEFFYKTGVKFQRFMIGRYGTDKLTNALFVFYLIGLLISNIFYRISKISYYSLWVLSTSIIVFAIFRVFSKNIEARRSENQAWLNFTFKVKSSFNLSKEKFQQRKTHKFVRCKKCRKVLRLPKNKGKINVACPHCQNQFIINTGKKQQ